MKKEINQRWMLSLRQALPLINTLHNLAPSTGVEEFSALVEHGLRNHGEDYTIKLLKAYRTIIHQFVLQQTITPIAFCKTDSDGFPKVLLPWKVSGNSPVERIKYVMTVWRLIDLFRCKPKYEVSTIVSKTQPDESLIDSIIDFIKSWPSMKLLGSQPDKGYLVMSTKAGPNGPATISCLKDLAPLKKEADLYDSVKKLMHISVPDLDMDSYDVNTSGRHSKLVLLSDKACKTRVVAIADWWSNTALSGIHRSFMRALHNLENDVTFRQDQIPKLIKGFGSNLYSADMTAFTDTFPRRLEKELINVAWPGVGDLWEQVISNRAFDHPKGPVKYATGNPMGLLSSWPVSSFTHHAVKQWCAHNVGKQGFYKYLVLGDDSLDTDATVHKNYRTTISKLGVSLSPSKCTQSESANAEFAKRYFLHGEEITGLPVDLLCEVSRKPEQFLELIRIARERGYEDQSLAPGVNILISEHKSAKMLADVLALPEVVSGMRPLLSVKPSSYAETLSQLPEEVIKQLVTLARESEFYELVSELEKAHYINSTSERNEYIPRDHPMIEHLSCELTQYLEHEGGKDPYSIYNSWMRGEYREMAFIPSPDNYRVRNKGHFVTRCKYNIFKKTLALANGDCNIPLQRFAAVTNWGLFSKGFASRIGPI